MSRADALRQAQKLIAGGWSEPFSRDTQGRICGPHDEGVASYSVTDALLLATGNTDELEHECAEALEHVLGRQLSEWLNAPERRTAEVLRAFDLAILQAEAVR